MRYTIWGQPKTRKGREREPFLQESLLKGYKAMWKKYKRPKGSKDNSQLVLR